MGESDDYVFREILVDLEELTVVHDAPDDLVHVVRTVGVVRDYLVEAVVDTAHRVIGWDPRSLFHVVLRNI